MERVHRHCSVQRLSGGRPLGVSIVPKFTEVSSGGWKFRDLVIGELRSELELHILNLTSDIHHFSLQRANRLHDKSTQNKFNPTQTHLTYGSCILSFLYSYIY